LADALDEWPIPTDDLGAMVDELRWFVWDAYEPVLGWQLRLAVWDPVGAVAWAIAADDAA
jgi:hypothetical protein